MIRVIRTAGLALVLVSSLLCLTATATDLPTVPQDGTTIDGFDPVIDRVPQTTVEYGDPDDISGNRGANFDGEGIDTTGLFSGIPDSDEELYWVWLTYLNMLQL